MYRMILADDEPNLVEGLYDLFSGTLPADTEIFKAYSAADVCSLLTRVSADLILSDIRMPGISGLDMLSRVEALCPHCRVMFLTGYDTFSWAQEALRHPCCVDYLLKTQGDDAILAAVERQFRLIEAENNPALLLSRVSAQMEALRPMVSEQAVSRWLQGEQGMPRAEYLEIDPSAPTLLCLCHRNNAGALGTLFPAALRQLLKEHMGAFSTHSVVAAGWAEYAILAQRPGALEKAQATFPYIRARLETVQRALTGMDESVSFAVNGECAAPQALPARMRELRALMEKYCMPGRELILEKNLCLSQESGTDNGMIQWIDRYIRENLTDCNLSLATIADKTYYAPAYLSRLYKQLTGATLSASIAQARLETACRLLRERKLAAQDVGRAVGFKSPSYFSVFFKRRIGKTPVEYMRDLTGR